MTPPHALTPRRAQQMLRRALPAVRVVDVVERTGGEFSAVYELRCARPVRRLIVKVYDDEWRWKQAKELHVYGLLAERCGAAVPAVVHSEGSGGPADRAFTVMTALDGVPLSQVSAALDAATTRALYREMGAHLAAVHQVEQEAFGYVTTGVVDPEPTNAAYMARQFGTKLEEFATWGGEPALGAAVRAVVDQNQEAWGRCAAPRLCHNDFHEGNVLVDQDRGRWRVTGFVDVENAVAADPLVDLAKTEYYAVRGDAAKQEGLVQGYGELPGDAQGRLRLYRLYHALELWDWFASIGRTAPLPGIADDIRGLVTSGGRP